MTMVDTDLELILLEDASVAQQCESIHHPVRAYNHQDSDLFYVRFYTCLCKKLGVTIRCEAWIKGTRESKYWMCATCGTTSVVTDEWFEVLGPVDKA